MNLETPAPTGSAREPAWEAWLTPGRFAALLGLLIFVLHPDILLGTHTFVFRDYGLYSFPVAHYVRESFWRGEVPLWNPLSNCGIPFLAQWSTLALYPPFLFCVLFPLSWSLGVFCLLHLFWAGLGMYFLAHRWTGSRLGAAAAGLAFAFNGLMTSCLMWPFYLAVISWAPFVILAVERAWREGGRALIVAALLGALQMVAGIPEIILLTWILLSGLLGLDLWAGKFPRLLLLRRFGGIVVLVTALAAAQLFPFLDFLAHSNRDASFAGGEWAMPSTGWANFFVPLFLCFETSSGVFMQHGQDVVSSYYQGLGVLALAFTALWITRERRLWLFAALTLAGVVLAMGNNGPFYAALRTLFPPLGLMRYPVKFVFITMFTAPLLCAFAVRELFGPDLMSRRRTWRVLLTFAGIGLVIVAGLLIGAGQFPQEISDLAAARWNGVVRVVLLVALLTMLWRALQAETPRSQVLGAAAFLLVIWGDLVTHAPPQNPVTDRAVFESTLPSAQELRPAPRAGEARAFLTLSAYSGLSTKILKDAFNTILLQRVGLLADTNLPEQLAKVDGFYSLFLREERDVLLRCLWPNSSGGHEPLMDFLGVAQVLVPAQPFYEWRARTNYLSLVTAGQRPIFADATNTLAALAESDFDPRTTVYLPLVAVGQINLPKVVTAHTRMIKFSAHEIEFEVTAEEPTLAVVAQSFYHPWKAYVNGAATPLLRANHAYQALAVPAQTSRVRLVYEDVGFRAGALLTVCALLACGVAWRRLRPHVNTPNFTAVL